MSLPSQIPALGSIAGLARKEPIYDTEVLANTIGTSINTFANFTSFANSPTNVLTKQFGRDTNLTGSQGGLPQAHRHMAYKWRCSVRTLDGNVANASNNVIFENIRRYRQLSSAIFQLAQTRYITVPLTELVSFVDSEYFATTATNQYIASPNAGAQLGRDLTVGGEPKVLEPLESFLIVIGTPSTGTIATLSTVGTTTTGCNLYVMNVIDGVLTRGITG